MMEKTRILAHRGLVTAHQENTFAAIKAALDSPFCDGAEFDVFLTKDQKVVLFHDENMKRLTGIDASIYDMTWSELQHIDILDVLEVDGGMRTYARPEKMVLLEHILEEVRGHDFFLDIELKAYAVEWKRRHVGSAVARLVRDFKMEDQCVVSSFNYCMLWAAENAHKPVRTAIAYDDNMPLPGKWLNKLLEWNVFGRLLNASACIAEYTLLDDDSVAQLRARGLLSGSFTFFPLKPDGLDADTIAQHSHELQRLAKNGLYWIETDDVELAYKALSSI